MPRHNPTTPSADDGHSRHERRLERDGRARSRRRARRAQTATPDGFGRQRLVQVARVQQDARDLDQQVAEWRSELALSS